MRFSFLSFLTKSVYRSVDQCLLVFLLSCLDPLIYSVNSFDRSDDKHVQFYLPWLFVNQRLFPCLFVFWIEGIGQSGDVRIGATGPETGGAARLLGAGRSAAVRHQPIGRRGVVHAPLRRHAALPHRLVRPPSPRRRQGVPPLRRPHRSRDAPGRRPQPPPQAQHRCVTSVTVNQMKH